MKLKETEKSELERMTLNKSENIGFDDKGMSNMRGSIGNRGKGGAWSNIKDKA